MVAVGTQAPARAAQVCHSRELPADGCRFQGLGVVAVVGDDDLGRRQKGGLRGREGRAQVLWPIAGADAEHNLLRVHVATCLLGLPVRVRVMCRKSFQS